MCGSLVICNIQHFSLHFQFATLQPVLGRCILQDGTYQFAASTIPQVSNSNYAFKLTLSPCPNSTRLNHVYSIINMMNKSLVKWQDLIKPPKHRTPALANNHIHDYYGQVRKRIDERAMCCLQPQKVGFEQHLLSRPNSPNRMAVQKRIHSNPANTPAEISS